MEVLDHFYPLTEYKNVWVRAEWISSEIFEEMQKRDQAFLTAKLSKDPGDWDKAKTLAIR